MLNNQDTMIMFEPNSRYYNVEYKARTLADGRTVSYVSRRFPPRDDALPTMSAHMVSEGDRLDTIATRRLGDPIQFWRICDAQHRNLDPRELIARPGRTLRIPFPTAGV